MNDQEPTEAETVESTTETVDPTTDEVMTDTETVEPTTESEAVQDEVEPTAKMEPVEGEVVEPMSEKDAKRITQHIRLASDNARRSLTKLAGLLEQAKAGAADKALGYQSWSEYLVAVFSEEPLRLPREQRREIVDYLSGEGMSTRAIGKVVAVDQKTVVNDLRATREEISSPDQEGAPAPERSTERAGEDSSSPARAEDSSRETDPTTPDATRSAVVTRTEGRDGKSYPRQRPEPTAEQKSQLRVEERQRAAARTRRNGVKGATALRHCSLKDLASADAATLGADADTFREAATWLDKAAAKAQTPGEDGPDGES